MQKSRQASTTTLLRNIKRNMLNAVFQWVYVCLAVVIQCYIQYIIYKPGIIKQVRPK